MKLIVQDPNGSTCSCGTWLDHYNKFSKQAAQVHCPLLMCVEKADIGGHVKKESGADSTTYILPLCKRHASQPGEVIVVNDYLPLVPASVTETCANPQAESQGQATA
jgi:hypothetical protein